MINGKTKPADGEYALATTCFVLSSRMNREAIRWRREGFLFERVADNDKICNCCYGAIRVGDVYAVGIHSRYCGRCYGWVPADALKQDSAERTWPEPTAPSLPHLTGARQTGEGESQPPAPAPLEQAGNGAGKYGLTSGREMRHAVHINSITERRVQ